MTTRNKGFGDSESRFAGIVRGVVVCALLVGAVLVGAGMHRHGAIVPEASAAMATDDAARDGYFPAQFPAPQGAPEAHIEAF